MATAQNTLNPFSENEADKLFEVATRRASESMQIPDSDQLGHYPMLWIYSAWTGKDWDQVREDASARWMRSLTNREKGKLLAVLDSDVKAAYRNMCEYFSMFLYCKWTNAGSVRRHKWTSFELALTCPENNEAIRRTDFQERLDDSIAYLDFDMQ